MTAMYEDSVFYCLADRCLDRNKRLMLIAASDVSNLATHALFLKVKLVPL